jgi:uncharacterized protein (DUF1778 family)
MAHANRRPTGRDEVKDERLEARVPADLKTMFQRAADIEGVTLSNYLVTALVERSRATIREHEIITLSGRNRDVFLEALKNPPAIAPKLAAALAKLEEPHGNRRTVAVARDARAGKLRQRKRSPR